MALFAPFDASFLRVEDIRPSGRDLRGATDVRICPKMSGKVRTFAIVFGEFAGAGCERCERFPLSRGETVWADGLIHGKSITLYKWVQLVKVLDVFPEIPGIFVKIIVSGVRNEIWRFFHFSIARVAKPLRAGMGLVPRE
jgi:hypothetical protein